MRRTRENAHWETPTIDDYDRFLKEDTYSDPDAAHWVWEFTDAFDAWCERHQLSLVRHRTDAHIFGALTLDRWIRQGFGWSPRLLGADSYHAAVHSVVYGYGIRDLPQRGPDIPPDPTELARYRVRTGT